MKIRAKILIGILILMMIYPATSHGFGLFRYIFDAVYNQLGLDRGSIPKAAPQPPKPGTLPDKYPLEKHDPDAKIHIQAEGF